MPFEIKYRQVLIGMLTIPLEDKEEAEAFAKLSLHPDAEIISVEPVKLCNS